MTSETWFGAAVLEHERRAIGNRIRRYVSGWEPGHVEAFVTRREGHLTVECAQAYPKTAAQFDPCDRLQHALDAGRS